MNTRYTDPLGTSVIQEELGIFGTGVCLGFTEARDCSCSVSTGCASFRPHPPLPRVLLRGCTGRSAPRGAHGLQRDGPLLRGPHLGRGEVLLCAPSASRPPPALRRVPAGPPLSSVSPLCPGPAAVGRQFPSFPSALPECTRAKPGSVSRGHHPCNPSATRILLHKPSKLC